MNHSLVAPQTIDADFLIRSALDRIRELEVEIKKLRQQQPVREKFIWVNQGQKLIRINLADILYIQSESNYSRIFTKSGQQFFMSRTLKSWMNEIPESDFMRCHRSFLVNKKEILEINRSASHITLYSGQSIPVSRRKQKNDVKETTGNSVASENTRCKVHKLSPNTTTKK